MLARERVPAGFDKVMHFGNGWPLCAEWPDVHELGASAFGK